MSENPKEKTPRFNCDYCNTKTNNKKDFYKHLATDKHKKKEFESNSNHIHTVLSPLHLCSKCNKSYNSKGGLWYHEKRCLSPKPVTNIDYKELVNQLLTDNRELRNFIIEQSKATADNMEFKNFIIEQSKVNADTMNKVIEQNADIMTKVLENSKTTVINQTNNQNNNQKFNIAV